MRLGDLAARRWLATREQGRIAPLVASRFVFAVVLALGVASVGRAEEAAQQVAAAERARFEDAMPRGPSVEERLEEIRRRLQAALVYPPIARRLGLEGVAWVQFSIDHAGVAQDVDVARSSGHPMLDKAARRTVDHAGRLPWVYGRIEVPIRFALHEGDPQP